jgi:hypothetical protein
MRGWALDTYPPQPRIQTQTPVRFGKAIDAYRPDHPKRKKKSKLVIVTKVDSCKQIRTAYGMNRLVNEVLISVGEYEIVLMQKLSPFYHELLDSTQ